MDIYFITIRKGINTVSRQQLWLDNSANPQIMTTFLYIQCCQQFLNNHFVYNICSLMYRMVEVGLLGCWAVELLAFCLFWYENVKSVLLTWFLGLCSHFYKHWFKIYIYFSLPSILEGCLFFHKIKVRLQTISWVLHG